MKHHHSHQQVYPGRQAPYLIACRIWKNASDQIHHLHHHRRRTAKHVPRAGRQISEGESGIGDEIQQSRGYCRAGNFSWNAWTICVSSDQKTEKKKKKSYKIKHMSELISLNIIPALFVKYTKDSAILLCYLGQSKANTPIVQKRKFDKILIEHIKNPTKILIAIKTETGSRTFTYICGKRYRKPFAWASKQNKTT